jgi:hypothetical protein
MGTALAAGCGGAVGSKPCAKASRSRAANNIAGMKKQAMAEAAEQRLAGTGWRPELLRTGPATEREAERARVRVRWASPPPCSSMATP